MRPLRNVPIRKKLVLIIMLATGGALALASAGLIVSDLRRFRAEMAHDLSTLAEIVAANTTAALTFDDPAAAAETLAALAARRSVVAAALYGEDGQLFARYVRSGAPQRLPLRPGELDHRFHEDGFELFQPVVLDGRRIGTVYLESDLSELYERLRVQAGTVLVVLCTAGLVALLLSSWLQRLVSRPVLDLAETARAVSERKDYSLRATKSGSDEVGRLVDSFNDMLAQIQERDSVLSQAHANEREARRQAEEANRLKDEFLATLSHELRTPLNAILGWAQMLRSGRLDEATTERAVETIERNAKAQAQLIADILDVSRIITGKLRLELGPVELPHVIEAALDSVRPAADAKEIHLAVRLDPQLPPLLGDANRLQQVVWNLLSNAIKFTPRGGRVEVELRQSGPGVEVRVSDTGIGIRPDFLPYVFDRFRQAESSTTRAHGGLGLGLSIVRHLVELHGGTVAVESPGEGQGTTFIVHLPVRSAALAVDRRQSHPAWSAPPLDGLHVLVLEDEADTRELVTLTLTQGGAQVTAVPSAAEALAALDRSLPDVLVSDIGVPGEDGYSLLRKLRAREPARGGLVPAVALTAYARTEDRLQAFTAGFQMHLAKPVDPAELVAVVASLAGRRGVVPVA
jgi:signal transduction histidine kinase/ActR/RegA family two-component response regulator